MLDQALSQSYVYPRRAYQTVRIPPETKLLPDLPPGTRRANVINIGESHIVTELMELPVPTGASLADFVVNESLCYLTVLERHGKNGNVGHGLLRNFGLENGAVASSVGHDAHNLIIAGTNEADMRLALETLVRTQGGVCLVRDGKITALVELPIAGLIAPDRAPVVAERVAVLRQQWTAMGCRLPYMGFNLLPLSVIPAARLTDKGIIQVPEMVVRPLFSA
jgi:adenine deaminase